MTIWTRLLASSEDDEKTKGVRKILLLSLLFVVLVGGLAVWTCLVVGLREIAYKLSGAGDGSASVVRPSWTPYILLWSIPVLIAILLGLMARASMRKKKKDG